MAYVVVGGAHPAEATGAADAEVLNAVDAVHDGRRHHADAVEGTSAGRRLETRVALRLRQRLVDHLGHLITQRHTASSARQRRTFSDISGYFATTLVVQVDPSVRCVRLSLSVNVSVNSRFIQRIIAKPLMRCVRY